jgi:hypothetical protein
MWIRGRDNIKWGRRHEKAPASSLRGLAFSLGFFEVRSIARAVAPAAATPPIVQTDAHDVVGCPTGIRNDRRRGGERPLRVAEVDVEIFELAAPAAAERTLEAGAGGPSGEPRPATVIVALSLTWPYATPNVP